MLSKHSLHLLRIPFTGNLGSGFGLQVPQHRIGPNENKPMQSIHAARCGSLVHRRVPQRILSIRIRLRIEQNPHYWRVAVTASPMQRRGTSVVRYVGAGTVFNEVKHGLRRAGGAGVVHRRAAFRIDRVQKTADLCVQLEEKQVPIKGRLKDIGSVSRVLPGRDAEDLIAPVAAILSTSIDIIRADLIALIIYLDPCAKDWLKFPRSLPLSGARRRVMEKQATVIRGLHDPAEPLVGVGNLAT
mmetsp:Transcript_68774/g.149679  ORF Transcript_68774/g.149679 Transcript_68774/m.149679 type:complete len:243 (-) Transcript_68774:308-1036(-)